MKWPRRCRNKEIKAEGWTDYKWDEVGLFRLISRIPKLIATFNVFFLFQETLNVISKLTHSNKQDWKLGISETCKENEMLVAPKELCLRLLLWINNKDEEIKRKYVRTKQTRAISHKPQWAKGKKDNLGEFTEGKFIELKRQILTKGMLLRKFEISLFLLPSFLIYEDKKILKNINTLFQ